MAIPSFEELLSQARALTERESEIEASTARSSALAKGLAGLGTTLLGTPIGGERKTYVAGVTPEGGVSSFKKPVTTGTNLLERGLMKFLGVQQPQIPTGNIPLTQEQAQEYGTRSALEGRKFTQQKELEAFKQSGRENLLDMKLNAQKESAGSSIKAATQPLGRATSDYIYKRINIDPAGKPTLTYGEADRILRGESIDTNSFFKELGIEVQLSKGLFGETSEEDKARVLEKMGKGKGGGFMRDTGLIRVKDKSTGETGTIPANEFDASLYEKVK